MDRMIEQETISIMDPREKSGFLHLPRPKLRIVSRRPRSELQPGEATIIAKVGRPNRFYDKRVNIIMGTMRMDVLNVYRVVAEYTRGDRSMLALARSEIKEKLNNKFNEYLDERWNIQPHQE